jgi:hypothetical protein
LATAFFNVRDQGSPKRARYEETQIASPPKRKRATLAQSNPGKLLEVVELAIKLLKSDFSYFNELAKIVGGDFAIEDKLTHCADLFEKNLHRVEHVIWQQLFNEALEWQQLCRKDNFDSWRKDIESKIYVAANLPCDSINNDMLAP